MEQNIAILENDGTWDLTQLPIGKQLLSNKWVYKIKHKADRTIERYKARFVIL